jgi:Domain of unknown function (DUF4350)
MKLFASVDGQDRTLLIVCLGSVILLAILTALGAGSPSNDNNPIPSSDGTGKHGARAAYEMLESSGYRVDRWEQPLSDLARESDSQTVLILADPILVSPADFEAVKEILDHGGRVLATGISGGALLPDGAVEPPNQLTMAACKLSPQGLDAVADSGEVWMVPAAGWKLTNPLYRVEYDCAGQPAVVDYEVGPGHVVWWASSTPLENASINRAGNLDLFLNALGSREGHHVYWDESLHGELRSTWFYAQGPALNLLIGTLLGLSLLIIFSFSRRNGPVRDLPLPVRATPVEFLEALGSLYANAGASATAVTLAYDRFRRRIGALCGLKGLQMSADQLGRILRRRFPEASEEMEADLKAGEEAGWDDTLNPKRALGLVQALSRHDETLHAAAHLSRRAK